ncbi:MAG: ADP-ribosylation factor-like protein [Desulfuromonadales bacterium]|nr:ADP-ribosylation factor-like protein [Desulfuromonadales bacterium]
MSFINYAAKEINYKIVYYGPALCGKTKNLQYIHEKTPPDAKGKMISLATEADKMIFFDFLTIFPGEIHGFKARFHLYTVPGQVSDVTPHKLILKGIDGIVFVADSQKERHDANIESLNDLRQNLQEQGHDLDSIPLVIQYNKRDLPNIMPVADMRKDLNPRGVEDFEACANAGTGVFETLKAIAKSMLSNMNRG